MSDFFKRLRAYFFGPNGEHKPPPALDLAPVIDAIERAENEGSVDPGRRIHTFPYLGFELRLDRDVMGQYRLTVNEGRERRYSFTIVCEPGDYTALRTSYEEITSFLNSDRHLANLPNHERLKGHFYGQ